MGYAFIPSYHHLEILGSMNGCLIMIFLLSESFPSSLPKAEHCKNENVVSTKKKCCNDESPVT